MRDIFDHREAIRYGKSFADTITIKDGMYRPDPEGLARFARMAELYKSQPRRTECKICGTKLGDRADITSHDIDYFVCPNCGHLNGSHRDTDEFCTSLYVDSDYAASYIEPTRAEYEDRTDAIYAPKARFLTNELRRLGEDPSSMSFLDIGAGAGYLVAALLRYVDDVRGIEPSAAMADLAARMIGRGRVETCDLDRAKREISVCESDVVSFIGVLEHLSDLDGMVEAIRSNSRVRYLFVSVPLFSLSVLIESVFPNVVPRHLGIAHDHLFTKRSLVHLLDRMGLEIVSTWDFGSDITDLFRSMLITLEEKGSSQIVTDLVRSVMAESCDQFQIVLDKAGAASETHVIARRR